AYESLWSARAEQLASVSLVLSRMPDVRAAFNTGDQATIRDTAGEVWDKIARRNALFLVTDPRGVVLAGLGASTAKALRALPAVHDAAPGFPRHASGSLLEEGRLYQIVITPVYVAGAHGPDLLNVLVAGLAVDSEMARELKQGTGGSEFVFLSGGHAIA